MRLLVKIFLVIALIMFLGSADTKHVSPSNFSTYQQMLDKFCQFALRQQLP